MTSDVDVIGLDAIGEMPERSGLPNARLTNDADAYGLRLGRFQSCRIQGLVETGRLIVGVEALLNEIVWIGRSGGVR